MAEPIKTEEIKPKQKEPKKTEDLEYFENVMNEHKEDESEKFLDVSIRTQKRYVYLYKNVFSAKSKKFPNMGWVTLPPKIYMSKLTTKINNGVGQIYCDLYELDESKKNKKYLGNKHKEIDEYGNEKTVERSGEYPIRYKMIETITNNKDITREFIDLKYTQRNIQKMADEGKIKF